MTKKITLDYRKIAILMNNSKKIERWFEDSKLNNQKPFPILSKV